MKENLLQLHADQCYTSAVDTVQSDMVVLDMVDIVLGRVTHTGQCTCDQCDQWGDPGTDTDQVSLATLSLA